MLYAWRGDRRDHTELNEVISEIEAAIAKAIGEPDSAEAYKDAAQPVRTNR